MTETQTPGLQTDLLRLLHRSQDGFACFSRKHGEWEQVISLLPGLFETCLPTFDFTTDSYVTLNSMSIGRAHRSTASTSYLNAVYTDLDAYKVGLTVADTISRIEAMEAAGDIPLASVIVESGCGVWCLWLLVDPATGLPPRIDSAQRMAALQDERAGCGQFKSLDDARRKQHRQIERAIYHRLKSLGADPQCSDLARCIRIPGSIHSGSGKMVHWTVRSDASGNTPTYALDQLSADFPAPEPPAAKPRKHPARSTTSTPDARPMRLHQSRVRQFEKLRSIRGGFAEGHRNNAALMYATFLFRVGAHPSTIRRKVQQLGESCDPPLTETEVSGAVASGLKGYRFSNETIIERLGITSAEQEQLDTWQSAHRARTSTRFNTRRKLMQTIVEQRGGELPSIREMKRLLADHGHSASVGTIQNDCRLLGWTPAVTRPAPTASLAFA